MASLAHGHCFGSPRLLAGALALSGVFTAAAFIFAASAERSDLLFLHCCQAGSRKSRVALQRGGSSEGGERTATRSYGAPALCVWTLLAVLSCL